MDDLKIGMEATFDDPEGRFSRWGLVRKIEDGRVWLSHIGWGFIREIKGIRP